MDVYFVNCNIRHVIGLRVCTVVTFHFNMYLFIYQTDCVVVQKRQEEGTVECLHKKFEILYEINLKHFCVLDSPIGLFKSDNYSSQNSAARNNNAMTYLSVDNGLCIIRFNLVRLFCTQNHYSRLPRVSTLIDK